MQSAAEALENLRNAAEDQQQKQLQEQAESAAESLEKAAQKRSLGDYSGADKDLEEALRALGAQGKENQEKKTSDSKKSDDKSKAKSDTPQDGKSTEADNQQTQAAAAAEKRSEQEKNKMDAAQTDALLELMGQDEKMLRENIKQRRNRVAPVEKDW